MGLTHCWIFLVCWISLMYATSLACDFVTQQNNVTLSLASAQVLQSGAQGMSIILIRFRSLNIWHKPISPRINLS